MLETNARIEDRGRKEGEELLCGYEQWQSMVPGPYYSLK